ncbi:MAG: EpsD family peptidyl-prolyl cis-trans isomerase [Rhizobacter sp.]
MALRTFTPSRALGCALPLLTALTLAACGGNKVDGATQIAAKVNREEISVHQVNYFLQRQSGLAPDQVDAASRQTLEALVDQELVLQAAAEQHIDRDPAVVQALEAARRELIARAYTERLAQGVQPASADEIKQYYDSHPTLFANRRLYTLVDTAVVATPDQQKALQAQLPTTRNAADVAAVLRRSGLRFGTRQSTVGAEALPLQAVEAMALLREGQSHLVAGPRDAHVLTIVAAEPASLNETEARTSIENYLGGERKRLLMEQQIKALRSAARIEYRGRFAQLAPSADKPSPPASAPALGAVALSQGIPAASLK